ncbi:MAG: thiamine pyrophosphate-binding protein [Aeromicrobium sp.]
MQSETSLDGDFDRAWQLIANSNHSLVWAGGGALHAEAGSAICELGVRMCAPIVTTYSARGLVDPKHPCFVAGPIHEPEVGRLWDEADLVVAVGTDFDGMSTQNWSMPPPTHLLAANVDAEDASKNYEPDVTLIGDAADIVRALLTRVSVRPGLDELRSDLARVDRAVRHATELDDPEAARFLRAMETVLPRESVLVADMCIPGYWLAGYRRVPLPRTFAYPMGWGTLGFAFPAALGAALATTAPTVCVCGDGGFLFACGELATVAQEMIPVTVIVVDDGGYGMLRFDQRQAGDPPFGVDLARPDFVALARSFGIEATRITGFGESFRDALRHCIAEPGASVLVVDAHLKPPRTTSPRWYRRAAEAEDREES